MSKDLTLDEIQSFEGKYPKQLWYLFFSEMWERFCFYGMRGMLTFFMVNQLFMDEKVANLQYGATQAFVYALVGTSIGSLFFTLITLWSASNPIPLLIGDFRIIETSSIFVQTAFTVFASALIGASAPVWIAARTRIIDDMRNVR